MDPDHFASLVRFMSDLRGKAKGKGRGKGRPRRRGGEEPGVAVTLTPDHPLYREPAPPKGKARAGAKGKPHPDDTPTEADLAAVRSGRRLVAKDAAEARRLMRARQMVKAELGNE